MATPNSIPRLQGGEGVLRALQPRLAAGAQMVIDRIRTETGATPDELPYFTGVEAPPRQLTAVGEYPIVMLKIGDTTGRLDNREAAGTRLDDVYERVYRVKAIVLAFAHTMEAAELQTLRLGLAVRDGVLIDRLLVDTDATGAGPSAVVLTNDLVERYADVGDVSAGFVGSAEISFNVKVREYVVTPEAYAGGLPRAELIDVTTYPFPS